jgi:hypothetical protein
LNASITTSDDKQYLEYDISCLKKVEGPQEFIDYLDTYGKLPKSRVRLTSPTPLTYVLKGWDADGKEYSQTLAYTPLVAADKGTRSSSSATWLLIIGGIVAWSFSRSIWDAIRTRMRKKRG